MLVLGAIVLGYRASFIIFWGDRDMPQSAARHLRYVSVAIIPGMIAQLIAFPATQSASSIHWLVASVMALAAGLKTKSALWSMITGAATYIILLASPWF